MALSFNWAASTTEVDAATSVTAPLPTHASGNLLIFIGGTVGGGAWGTAPSGWTLVNRIISAGGPSTFVYYRIATSSSETNPTMAWTNASDGWGACCVVTGHDTSVPISTQTGRMAANDLDLAPGPANTSLFGPQNTIYANLRGSVIHVLSGEDKSGTPYVQNGTPYDLPSTPGPTSIIRYSEQMGSGGGTGNLHVAQSDFNNASTGYYANLAGYDRYTWADSANKIDYAAIVTFWVNEAREAAVSAANLPTLVYAELISTAVSSGSWTLTLPSAQIQAGDLLLLFLMPYGTGTTCNVSTTTPGWSEVYDSNANHAIIKYSPATAGQSSVSGTITGATASRLFAYVVVLRNADPDTIGFTTAASADPASHTPASSGDWLYFAFMSQGYSSAGIYILGTQETPIRGGWTLGYGVDAIDSGLASLIWKGVNGASHNFASFSVAGTSTTTRRSTVVAVRKLTVVQAGQAVETDSAQAADHIKIQEVGIAGVGPRDGYASLAGAITADRIVSQESPDHSAYGSYDLEIIVCLKTTSWGTTDIGSWYDNVSSGWHLRLQGITPTRLNFWIGDGTAVTQLTSATHTLATNTWTWLRYFYDYSAGAVSWYYSLDPPTTDLADVQWTLLDTQSGTARQMANANVPIILGYPGAGTSADFTFAFWGLWLDGDRETGDLAFRLDLRSGPDFEGSPATRVDDVKTDEITWELQNGATYTPATSSPGDYALPAEKGVPGGQPAGRAVETDSAQPASASKVYTVGQAVETGSAQAASLQRIAVAGQSTESDTANPATSAKVFAVGQALEADTANAATATKTAAAGQALETDTANPAESVALVFATQAVETDTAQAATTTKTYAAGQSVEADTAQAASVLDVEAATQALETNSAFPATATKTAAAGQALETDSAFGPDLAVQVAQALETDAAFAASSAKTYTVNQAVETDTAQAATAVVVQQVGQSLETDSAQAATAAKTYQAGQALETDTAFGPDLTIQIGQAVETDTAQPATAAAGVAAGQAVETDSAQAAMAARIYQAGQALETDTAQAATTVETYTAGQALETDSATAKSGMKYGLAVAVETDFALQVGVQDVETATQAVETDTALAATSAKTYLAGQALETDTAQAAAENLGYAAAQALESDTAFGPDLAIQVAQALETDSAFAASAATGTIVGQAVETDTAQAAASAKIYQAAQAVETDSAPLAATAKTYTTGQSLETDTANPATKASGIVAGQAVETDTALAATGIRVYAIGQALETDTANAAASGEVHPVGQALESDAAFAATKSSGLVAGQSAEADTAQPVATAKVYTVGQATTAASALAATKVTGIGAGLASEIEAAAAVSVVKVAALGLSLEGDTAAPVVSSKVYPVGQALESDTAQAAAVGTGYGAGLALETDTALQVAVAFSIPVSVAVETDTAQRVYLEGQPWYVPDIPGHVVNTPGYSSNRPGTTPRDPRLIN